MLRECALWSYTYIPVFIQIRSGFVGVITEKPFYDPQSDYNMGGYRFLRASALRRSRHAAADNLIFSLPLKCLARILATFHNN